VLIITFLRGYAESGWIVFVGCGVVAKILNIEYHLVVKRTVDKKLCAGFVLF
jgi:hypothetical protein